MAGNPLQLQISNWLEEIPMAPIHKSRFARLAPCKDSCKDSGIEDVNHALAA